MFYDIGKILNGRNDIRTNHRFRVVFNSEFCRTVISEEADSTVVIEFTEDDVRNGTVTITIEEEVFEDKPIVTNGDRIRQMTDGGADNG